MILSIDLCAMKNQIQQNTIVLSEIIALGNEEDIKTR
jgi:hypothetical protein